MKILKSRDIDHERIHINLLSTAQQKNEKSGELFQGSKHVTK